MSDIDDLFETLTNLQRSKRLPPLHLWQPEHVGVIDIRIDREGIWYHEGTRIERQPLVDLFATILRREKDDYYLVTPAEKMRIVVEEAPFIAIDLDVRGVVRPNRCFSAPTWVTTLSPIRNTRLSCAASAFLHIRDRLKPEFSAVCFTVWWKRVNSEATTCGSSAMAARSTWLGDRLKRCLQNFAYKIGKAG